MALSIHSRLLKYALDLAKSSGAQIYAITVISILESYLLKENVLNKSRKNKQ